MSNGYCLPGKAGGSPFVLEMNKACGPFAKFIRVGLLSAITLAPAVSAAQGVSLASGLTDFTSWSLFGSATAQNQTPGNGFTYSELRLTNGTGGEAGAGFAPAAITLDFNQSFSFDFHFFIPVSKDLRGDGMTFTLSDTPGVGGGGSSLGYAGLSSNSVAFAIDTFNFDGEPVSPSLQILQHGASDPLAATETGLGDTIRDPNFQWFASVLYTPSGNGDETGTLQGTIEHINLGTFSVSALVDLSTVGPVVDGGHAVFFGFTAGNGLATDAHIVTSAAPVPLPAALWLLGSALGGLGMVRRRTGHQRALARA